MSTLIKRVREVFAYNPETGDFIRKIATSRNVKLGTVAGSAPKKAVSGRKTNLGYFKTAEGAHTAYLTEKRRVHPACTI